MTRKIHYTILSAEIGGEELDHLKELVSRLGRRYELKTIESERIVAEAQNIKPDLIIVGWEKQSPAGLQNIRLIKKDPLTRLIPIIVAIGEGTSVTDVKDAMSAGAYDCLGKPLDPVEFTARVKSALRLYDLHKQIMEQNHQIKLQSESHNRVKNRIFRAFLVYAVVAFLVSTFSFWLFRQLEDNEKIVNQVNRIETKVLAACENDQVYFNKSTFFHNHFKSNASSVFVKHSATFADLGLDLSTLENFHGIAKFEVGEDIKQLRQHITEYDVLYGESLLNINVDATSPDRHAELYNKICVSSDKIQAHVEAIAQKVSTKDEEIVGRFRILNVTIVTASVILTLLLTISIKFVFNGNKVDDDL